jgi:hypothetical protein
MMQKQSNMKLRWQNPEFRKRVGSKISESVKKLWLNDQYRKRMIETFKKKSHRGPQHHNWAGGPVVRLNRLYLKRYGASLEQVNNARQKLNGYCPICKKHESEFKCKRKLSIDHDHKTKQFRGLLCTACNPKYEWFLTFRDNILSYPSA